MTEKINDQISAFIDDELIDEESQLLVRRLCNDKSLRQTAARYTLIGDAVRGSLDEIRADLNGNIMRAIEAEQTPAVPAAATGSSWWRLAGGGAVAAAVAALAVLAIRPATQPMNMPGEGLSAQSQQLVVPADRPPSSAFINATGPTVRPASNQSQLQSYLLRHKQYSKTTMGQGILVYSTIATEDAQGQELAPLDADARLNKGTPKQ